MAQSSAASSELKGLVTDPNGAVVPGVSITVTNLQQSITRTVTTDEKGEYRVFLLPPGNYEVKAEAQGFATQVNRRVQITVGQIAVLDFQLRVGVTTEVVEVLTSPALIETQRTQQSDTIESRYIQDLPINRRDYLTFTLLAPGVVDSDAFADNTDFRVTQTPQSGLSFYGSNGRGNNVMVDGGEANDDAGGVRSTISQEAVLEFQINRSNYTAEFGGASGGVINIVSKSGGNEVHGSGFGFFRHDGLDAADPFAVELQGDRAVRVDPPSDRQQYGGSIGFPIKRDRSFFFAAFEGFNRDESAAVPVLTDVSIFGPTAAQEAILSRLPPEQAAPLRSVLTASPTTREIFRVNSGIFPFEATNYMFSLRWDHHFSETDQLIVRYNYTNEDEQNPNLRALIGFSRGNFIEQLDSTVLAGWTHTFSPRAVNEVRFQWNYNDFFVTPNDPFGPELSISGFGFFNRDIFLPSFSRVRHYEVLDNFNYTRGNHNFKFGGLILARHNEAESHTFFPGRFNFGPLPGGLISPALASTTITGLQAFNLGLPQFYQQGFGDPTVVSTLPFYAVYAQDNWNVTPNFTLNYGLRYELDDRRDPIRTDDNNFAPRLGFAWDPFGDHKTTIRGGYGVYYSPIYYQIDYVVNALGAIGANNFRQIAQVFVPLTGATTPTGRRITSAEIYQTLLARGVIRIPSPTRTITPQDLEQFGIPITHEGPIPPLSVIFSGSDDYANSYAQQASLGIEREIVSDLGFSANYIFSRGLKITRARDKNLLPIANGPLGIRQWNAPQCANPFNCFANPLILQANVYESTGRSFFHGLILELNKRFSHHFSLSASYTFSKAIDEVTDFNSDFQPNDQADLRGERALSSFDQRHKFVIYAALESPLQGGSGAHPASRIFSGFVLTPIFRANSARPFNLLVGADLNADRHSTTDRPAFAGRNTGRGPDFWTFDLRVARRIGLGDEHRALELTFEAFNLFNHLNFASINNTVGAIGPPFDLHGRADRRPSEPLGFTSAFDPRLIQLGVRLYF